MIDFTQIENDLNINKYQLDGEALSLPSIYFRYSDAVREAKTLVSEKTDNLKVVLAERNIAIREDCASKNKKVTEGIISALVDSDSDVVTARKELRDAEAVYSRLNVMLQSLEVKKAEIDNLVKLYCNAYYTNKDSKGNTDMNGEILAHDFRQSMNPLPVNN